MIEAMAAQVSRVVAGLPGPPTPSAAPDTIGFVTDRAQRALAMEANQLLGGDAVVSSERPIEGAIAEAANATGLRQARTWNSTA